MNLRHELQSATYYSNYARPKDDGSPETWEESVTRVMSMHRKKYSDKMNDDLREAFAKVEKAYKSKLFVGSQRALQFGGDPIFKHEARLYNCSASYCDRPAFFGEAFYMLLCGTGVGASVQKHHIEKLPNVVKPTDETVVFQIPDTIEGWAKSVDVLLSSYFENGGKHPEYKGKQIEFDASLIRPKGAHISGGFKAPGPKPLINALVKIRKLLNAVDNRKLKPIEAYDIIMHISDAVLSGGVRRAAVIVLFSFDDEEMLTAKTGNWYETNPQRARSNNSAAILRGTLTFEQFKEIMNSVKEFGEPGFIFTDDLEALYNPCVAGDTLINTEKGLVRADQLINKPFMAIVNGNLHKSDGFFKTGTQLVYNVKTFRGHSIKATANHQMLIEVDGQEEWKELGELKIGDKLVIGQNSKFEYNVDLESDDFKKGWLVGQVTGDGCHNPKKYRSFVKFWGKTAKESSEKTAKFLKALYNKEHLITSANGIYATSSVNITELCNQFLTDKTKDFKDALLDQSDSFLCGLIQGYFDSDGTVFGSSKSNGLAVRLSSNNLERLEIMQTILNRFGIVSSIYNRRPEGDYLLPDGKGGEKFYHTKQSYDLHFSRESVDNFDNLCGFGNSEKNDRLKDLLAKRPRTPYKNHKTTKITSIEMFGVEDVYDCHVPEVTRFEANGLIIHNCVEVGLYGYYTYKDGTVESCWQGCNLTEGNGAMCVDKQSFLEMCEASAIMGTLQAGYTNFKFLGKGSQLNFEREALLGCSITGWMNNPDTLLDDETLKEGADLIKSVNKYIAALIGINPAARTTCVKPSGNSSALLGTASNTGGEHAKRYIRNAQYTKNSNVAKQITKDNPTMVENSVWSANDSDIVVSYPIEVESKSIYKNDMLGVKHLDVVKFIQKHWVENGKDKDLCVQPWLSHNVSNTISVDDWDAVTEYLFNNQNSFAGVSFLGLTGDKDYAQAPFVEVLTEDEFQQKYGEGFNEFGVRNGLYLDDHDRINSKNWFNLSAKEKDAFWLNKWNEIQQTYKPIQWHKIKNMKDIDIDTMGAVACSGGSCEL